MQHAISIEGRSLIRTFLADATKDAADYLYTKKNSALLPYGCKAVFNSVFFEHHFSI